MNIYEKLQQIQADLKAPKGQFNSFGGYKYRSCEDITEAAKPHLKAVNAVLLLNDELVLIGTRYYIKATATLADAEGTISVNAYAREEESQKGMTGAQQTGSASSYARKYALNGLFALDDTKDPDATHGRTDVPRQEQAQPQAKKPERPQQPPRQPIKREDVVGYQGERQQQRWGCDKCGVPILQREAEYSQKHYGAPLCRACQSKLNSNGRR
jgi:hypothetical protein